MLTLLADVKEGNLDEVAPGVGQRLKHSLSFRVLVGNIYNYQKNLGENMTISANVLEKFVGQFIRRKKTVMKNSFL